MSKTEEWFCSCSSKQSELKLQRQKPTREHEKCPHSVTSLAHLLHFICLWSSMIKLCWTCAKFASHFTSVQNIINTSKYLIICTWVTLGLSVETHVQYCCPILNKTGFFRQVPVKLNNVKFHENSYNSCRIDEVNWEIRSSREADSDCHYSVI